MARVLAMEADASGTGAGYGGRCYWHGCWLWGQLLVAWGQLLVAWVQVMEAAASGMDGCCLPGGNYIVAFLTSNEVI